MRMTRGPDRKPSTLAASRAMAASRPIPIPAAKGSAEGKASGPEIPRGLAQQPVAPVTQGRARRNGAKAGVKGTAEHRIVFTVVVCFLACVATLSVVRINDNMQATTAKVGIETTFKRVHRQQLNFRVLNSRFATWNELAATGATLPPFQSVAASNADASHWFLSLRDRHTSVVCDQTGELFDESADERTPVCRDK